MSYLTKKPRILFIHIPKTAGRSVMKSLEQQYGVWHISNGRTSKNKTNYHSTLADYEEWIEDSERTDIPPYIFTVVRNPWMRAASWFFFRERVLQFQAKRLHRKNKLKQQLYDELAVMRKGFEPWLEQYHDVPWQWTWFKLSHNQSHWLKSDKNKVDKVIRFENLDEIKTVPGLERIKLPHTNKGTHLNDYKLIYNTNTRKFIAKLYEEDIDRFKYTFE